MQHPSNKNLMNIPTQHRLKVKRTREIEERSSEPFTFHMIPKWIRNTVPTTIWMTEVELRWIKSDPESDLMRPLMRDD